VIPRVNDDLPEELPARYKYCCPGHPSWTVLKFEVTLLAGFQMTPEVTSTEFNRRSGGVDERFQLAQCGCSDPGQGQSR
jgi:hypothetical protein